MYHITYEDDLKWIIHFVSSLYKDNMKAKSPERIKFFDNFALATEILFKAMFAIYALSVFPFFAYPVYMYCFKNELVPILQLHFPFVDHSTPAGYIFLTIQQILAFFCCVVGLLAVDFFMTIIMMSTLIFAKLIAFEMEQICVDLQVRNSVRIVKVRFKNLILMHQELMG